MLKKICNIVGEDFPRVGVDIKDAVKDNIFVKKGRLAEVEVLGNCSNSRKGFHKAASLEDCKVRYLLIFEIIFVRHLMIITVKKKLIDFKPLWF